jgi:carboxyvinyl-carboxyphosphonate phosphorylmutase
LDRPSQALSRRPRGRRCIHPGSVFDPISARIAEDLGFEVGMFAGSTASLAVLGAPT